MKSTRILSHTSIFTTLAIDRFSYYGMRSILILYLISNGTDGLGLEREQALDYYGKLTIALSIVILPVGLFSDFISGQRWGVIIGLLLSGIGIMVIPWGGLNTVLMGAGAVCLGTNLTRNNLWVLLGRHYVKGDNKRDGVFTIGYLFLNIGSFLGVMTVGIMGDKYGWEYGFSLAGLICLISIPFFFFGTKDMDTKEFVSSKRDLTYNSLIGSNTNDNMVMPTDEMKKENIYGKWWALFILLICGHVFFWPLYGLASMQIESFAESAEMVWPNGEVINYTMLGIVNSYVAFPILLLFGLLWHFKSNPNTWKKIGIGLLTLSFSAPLILSASNSGVVNISAFWIYLGIVFLFSIAETFIGPVILSTVTRLAPQKYSTTFFSLYLLGSWILYEITELLIDFLPSESNFTIYTFAILLAFLGISIFLFHKKMVTI